MLSTRNFSLLTLLLVLITLQGCANSLYQSEISAQDSQGQTRQFVLYWTKTEPIIGEPKAGPAVLLTQCGVPVTFVEQPGEIVFRGVPGQDRLANQDMLPEDRICGRFVGETTFIDLEAGILSLTMVCEPIIGDFSVNRAYLKASPDLYQFQVSGKKSWSLFGKRPDAPKPPACPGAESP